VIEFTMVAAAVMANSAMYSIDREPARFGMKKRWWYAAVKFYNEMVAPSGYSSDDVDYLFDHPQWRHLDYIFHYWMARESTADLLFGEHK
jgi:hypothetical protein